MPEPKKEREEFVARLPPLAQLPQLGE